MPADPPVSLVWENQRRVLTRPGMWTTRGLAFGIPSALARVVAAIARDTWGCRRARGASRCAASRGSQPGGQT